MTNEIKVIESDVPCSSCGRVICNLCAFNTVCQHCGTDLSRGDLRAFDIWWDRHGDEALRSRS